MAKTKKPAKPRDIPKTPAAVQAAAAPPAPKSHAFRETVESIVIAFVLAFLFRTFEAEAFVIPTGSMAPTLMGRHKDVECPKCGYRYQVSASEEAPENPEQPRSPCLAGMCPMCGYLLPMVPSQALPPGVVERQLPDLEYKRSYNGDRILVNKYDYTLNNPQRWDVVVFKFPEDAKVNYIKRLVGLPDEKLRVYQGDLFVGDNDAEVQTDFDIARKPTDKVLSMRQLVHDTDYDAAELDAFGWPLRWTAVPGDGEGWKVDKTIEDINVRQRYSVDSTGKSEAWLHYNHFMPTYSTWRHVIESDDNEPLSAPQPKLITDANPYNARVHGFEYEQTKLGRAGRLAVDPRNLGLHWVGDLMLEADVEIESDEGQLLVELVEGGKAFRATIDLKTGAATLSAPGDDAFAPKAKTSIARPGSYRIGFSNVDDQLLLWVDGEPVEFDASTAYDVSKVFGDRREIIPHTSDEDPGDLAPARIGASNAKLAVDRLQLWRDIYYIAPAAMEPIRDLALGTYELSQLHYTPSQWDRYKNRHYVDFPLHDDQFFVMGDNSAESSDARLWGDADAQGEIHGQYLERRLLIGKALSVYWPHSWNRIPGTPIPFPLFPNFEDMRLVR
jgi:signal peptidase I